MIRSMFSRALFTLGVLVQGVLVLPACSDYSGSDSDAASTGTFSMPLLASAGTHTYRLQGSMYASGPVFTYIDLTEETDVFELTLPTGVYSAVLYSWWLERDDGAGHFVPVSANLLSSDSQPFSIFNQTTTTLTFQFETDGQIVTVGAGQLVVGVSVTENQPSCRVLGSDCETGTWCAPSELTGAPLACIPEGPVAQGEPCESPHDCTSNTSCFDFGAGALCASLCPIEQLDQPCSGGGICTAQAVDYGVCAP
ncbi:MAG TPA: hypothetical protein VER33_12790 [Polyangiaceae bacterium]|nr:hypothetical protein [Polyangiaceae bacterium]